VVLDAEFGGLGLPQQLELEIVLVFPLDVAQLKLLLSHDTLRQHPRNTHLRKFIRGVHSTNVIN
jgi:hypothetical protein